MNTNKQLVIGLFGFGVVGEGLYQVLKKTPSLSATIKKVCIKHPEKTRNAPSSLFTTDRNVLLYDNEINVIVEVIDDADAAFEIITTAFKEGKAVVSASKKMIAEHLSEILKMQKETNLPFLCEAAACASIPVIRNLEEYYDNDLLHGIRAIVNGSTNFILTKMFEENLPFADALELAQKLGFAESNPKLDVEGYDAVNKLCILLNHAYGIVERPENILFTGIQNVQLSDAVVAQEKGYEIKLVAHAQKMNNGEVATFVLPQFVRKSDYLSSVKNEYNGVIIESGFADKQLFLGKGAGSFPTATAVLSDISALRYNYKYEYKKLYYHTPGVLTGDFYLRVYVSFDHLSEINHKSFACIEEWYGGLERNYLVGIIRFDELQVNDWWKNNNVSLVVCPDGVLEDVDFKSIKTTKLELPLGMKSLI